MHIAQRAILAFASVVAVGFPFGCSVATEAQIDAAVARGDAIEVDLGFAFHCSVVSAAAYAQGTLR